MLQVLRKRRLEGLWKGFERRPLKNPWKALESPLKGLCKTFETHWKAFESPLTNLLKPFESLLKAVWKLFERPSKGLRNAPHEETLKRIQEDPKDSITYYPDYLEEAAGRPHRDMIVTRFRAARVWKGVCQISVLGFLLVSMSCNFHFTTVAPPFKTFKLLWWALQQVKFIACWSWKPWTMLITTTLTCFTIMMDMIRSWRCISLGHQNDKVMTLYVSWWWCPHKTLQFHCIDSKGLVKTFWGLGPFKGFCVPFTGP